MNTEDNNVTPVLHAFIANRLAIPAALGEPILNREALEDLAVVRSKAATATVFYIQNIADYICALEGFRDDYSLHHLGVLAPPYQNIWMEYRLPTRIKVMDEFFPNNFPYNKVGILLESNRVQDGGWFIHGHLVLGNDASEKVSNVVCAGLFGLDKDGKRYEPEDEAVRNPENESLLFIAYKMDSEHAKVLFWDMFYVAFFALALVNCKNVITETRGESVFRSMNRMGKRSKPGVRHRIIKLPAASTNGGTGEPSQDNGIAIPIHLCRGHFKDYAGSGLFGKYKGKFWWEAHVRGSGPGIVEKDYQVAPG